MNMVGYGELDGSLSLPLKLNAGARVESLGRRVANRTVVNDSSADVSCSADDGGGGAGAARGCGEKAGSSAGGGSDGAMDGAGDASGVGANVTRCWTAGNDDGAPNAGLRASGDGDVLRGAEANAGADSIDRRLGRCFAGARVLAVPNSEYDMLAGLDNPRVCGRVSRPAELPATPPVLTTKARGLVPAASDAPSRVARASSRRHQAHPPPASAPSGSAGSRPPSGPPTAQPPPAPAQVRQRRSTNDPPRPAPRPPGSVPRQARSEATRALPRTARAQRRLDGRQCSSHRRAARLSGAAGAVSGPRTGCQGPAGCLPSVAW